MPSWISDYDWMCARRRDAIPQRAGALADGTLFWVGVAEPEIDLSWTTKTT